MTLIELAAAFLLVLGSTLVIRAVIAADAELVESKRSPAQLSESESAPRLGRAA